MSTPLLLVEIGFSAGTHFIEVDTYVKGKDAGAHLVLILLYCSHTVSLIFSFCLFIYIMVLYQPTLRNNIMLVGATGQ